MVLIYTPAFLLSSKLLLSTSRGHNWAVGGRVVAARLEQTAEPGQILSGDQTKALLGDAVRAEELPPLSVKGKREPVRGWRLL